MLIVLFCAVLVSYLLCLVTITILSISIKKSVIDGIEKQSRGLLRGSKEKVTPGEKMGKVEERKEGGLGIEVKTIAYIMKLCWNLITNNKALGL